MARLRVLEQCWRSFEAPVRPPLWRGLRPLAIAIQEAAKALALREADGLKHPEPRGAEPHYCTTQGNLAAREPTNEHRLQQHTAAMPISLITAGQLKRDTKPRGRPTPGGTVLQGQLSTRLR